MPELDVAEPESGYGRGDAILISVRPPDGPAIAAILRARGYVVAEAPLGLVAARALSDAPRVLILDVDQPGAINAVERLRELSAGVELICVGDTVRAAELGVAKADGRAFERPIDLDSLALAVVALAEPRDAAANTSPPARERATAPPQRMDSELPPMSELPSTSDPLDVAAILPSFEDTASSVRVMPAELSPELAQLLEAAEQRVGAIDTSRHPSSMPHSSSLPSPDEELDLLVPPDLLAALDEPMDPEDEATGSGVGTAGTGAPPPRNAASTVTGTRGNTAAIPPPALTDRGDRAERGERGERSERSTRAEAVPPARAWERTGGTAPQASAPQVFQPQTPLPPAISAQPGQPYAAILQSQPYASSALAAPPSAGSPWSGPATRAAIPPQMQDDANDTPRPSTEVAPRIPEIPPAPAAPAWLAAPILAAPAPRFAPESSGVPTLTRPEPPVAQPAEDAPSDEGRPFFAVLSEGDALRVLARAVASRASGSLAVGPAPALRRVVLRDGDIVTAGSGAPDETLIAFLTARGDLERDVGVRLAGKLPPFGRHAGAALIAHGHLGQDDLWPVLRAHAEWIIGRAIAADSGTAELESEPPGRLKAEPAVFGGATGAEVVVEAVRRVIPPEVAIRRLGGPRARLAEGPRASLLGECALRPDEDQRVRAAPGRTVAEAREGADAEIAGVLYALVSLGVLEALTPAAPTPPEHALPDPLDEEALRQRVRARVALVEDGDYFAVLGVARTATGYEVRRAYLELRRAFEPSRVLTAATADLADDVRTVIEVLDEAYEILREPHRRERYKRAIEDGPPG